MIMPTCRRIEGSWSPIQEMRNLERELSTLFNGGYQPADVPAVNLWANEEEAVVTAELPGVAPEAVTLTVEGRILVLEAKRVPETLPEGGAVLREERPQVEVSRRIRLPYEVENDAIVASLRHGVLKVTLPRLARTRPTSITITHE